MPAKKHKTRTAVIPEGENNRCPLCGFDPMLLLLSSKNDGRHEGRLKYWCPSCRYPHSAACPNDEQMQRLSREIHPWRFNPDD